MGDDGTETGFHGLMGPDGVGGAAAVQISTAFDSDDFLPSGGNSIQDIESLDEAVGGRTEIAAALIEAELTDDRTLRNLLTLTESFGVELARLAGAATDITVSLGTLFGGRANMDH